MIQTRPSAFRASAPDPPSSDPVSSKNATLPDVSNVHRATVVYHCQGGTASAYTAQTVETEQGYFVPYPDRAATAVPPAPASRRIEVLSEVGPPRILAWRLAARRRRA